MTKTCECGCGRTFSKGRRDRRFFATWCAERVRTEKATGKPMRRWVTADNPKTQLFRELAAESRRGTCCYCDLPTKVPWARCCWSEECTKAYNTDHRSSARSARKEAS